MLNDVVNVSCRYLALISSHHTYRLNSCNVGHLRLVNASVASGAYLEIAPDPAADTSIKIVELSITQTVQGLTSIWTETGSTPAQEAAEWYFPAYGGICLQMSQQPHIVASQANENIGLKNETGSTCLYSGHVVYYLE